MTRILIACSPVIVASLLVVIIAFVLKVREERKRAEEVFRLLKEIADYEHRCKVLEEEIERLKKNAELKRPV